MRTLQSLSFAAVPFVLAAFAGCARTAPGPVDAPPPPPPVESAAPPVDTAPPPATSSAPPVVEAPKGLPPSTRRTDTVATSDGELGITPIQHGTVLFEYGGKSIYVDPTADANFDGLPKADVIFVTDIHPDHMDPAGIAKVAGPETVIVAPQSVADKMKVTTVIANGESKTIGKLGVEAIPMYNLKRGPSAGKLFHDKGRGDGYVLTFGDKRVYLSGDTECTPEMKALKNIDVAFVCMNLPYTMTPVEAAECVRAFKPKVVIPYHYRGQKPEEFKAKVGTDVGVEVRIRDMYPAAATPPAGDKPGTPTRPKAAEGKMCGGIANIQCADGLKCKMPKVTHPDASGVCVKN